MSSPPSSSSSQNHQILFLKTPSPTLSTDPYTIAFSPPNKPHFTTHYVPLLTHTLLPDPLIQLLLTYLSSPSPSQSPFPYRALILTSQRAVAALRTALSCPPVIQQCEQDPKKKVSLRELCIPLYTVGPATALAAQEVVENWLPGCKVLGGSRAGSGEVLARLILGEGPSGEKEACNDTATVSASVPEQGEEEERPMLFLAGEKRRDIIPRMLQQDPPPPQRKRPIKVTELTIYRTTELPEFQHTFSQTLRLTSPASPSPSPSPSSAATPDPRSTLSSTRWIVLFTPQSTPTILAALGHLDPAPGRAIKPEEPPSRTGDSRTFIAAIGPTTASHLQTHFNFSADVVAPAPSPESLRQEIVRFLREKGMGDGDGEGGIGREGF